MHAGSSSGLHHDYHDNLYCLLKGRKRFRIFPPDMADQLHTHGEIYKIHPNGRIVYKNPYVDQVREFVEHLPAKKYTNTYLQQILFVYLRAPQICIHRSAQLDGG